MEQESGRDDGAADLHGAGAALPPGASPSPRDPQLTGFARDGAWDTCAPSAALAGALEGAAGPDWRCPGASRDEMVGLLRQYAALEAWAAAGRLGVLRALIRDEGQPLPGGGWHGDLPDGWSRSLTYEAAAALAVSVPTAESMMWLAWDLHVRLPGLAGLLAGGILTCAKARAVADAFQLLSEPDAARAETMILPELPGKNYGQVKRLAEQAAASVDPESVTRRREQAEREQARVTMRREDSGAVALSGRDLPTDRALAAHARVCARAEEYRESGAFPAVRMDQLRATAYLDLLNGTTAAGRIATAALSDSASAPADSPHTDPVGSGDVAAGSTNVGADGADDATPVVPVEPPPRLADLVVPLATLLGLGERPGEGHGLGPLDPALGRALTLSAVGSPFSRLCVTVTDQDGIAIGHGCARLPARRHPPEAASSRSDSGPADDMPTALPARVNLTVPASRLTLLDRGGGSAGRWSFVPGAGQGPPGGFGAWVLTVPDGSRLTVDLEPVPTRGCDHRHQSRGYQPNDTLRHLVQVRDGDCTFPLCSRHARESDFEHAVPYDQGGRTCACNAGARSRACHQVKQSKGWQVTQPAPGWHQWDTPAGRTYTQGPKRYPD